MAMDAKTDMIRQIEHRLESEVTVSDMSRIMAAINDVLEGFDVNLVVTEPDLQDDLLESFVSAIQIQGRSQKTIDRYIYVIRKMMAYTKVSTRRISVYHLRSFLAAEKARGIAEGTLEGYREVLSAYFNWLQRESLIDRNPVLNLGVIKVPKKQKQIYTEVDLEKLTRSCDNIRDRAIIAFLAATGCRVSEVVELNRDQVDLERLQCVVHGKGDKERIVYLDAVAGMLLGEYLAERTDDDPALFYNRRHGRLLQNGIRVMLNRVADRAGVDHVHPHKFRRTLATNLTRRGMPIQDVAKILGHDKVDTTMRYVVLNDDDVKHAYRRYA